MKTNFYKFNSLFTKGLMQPVALDLIGTVKPVDAANENAGSILFLKGEIGIQAGPLYVKETIPVVTEAVQEWLAYAANAKHGTA